MATPGQKRQKAPERREAIVLAAIEEFAQFGYHGGSTERIAGAVGISQPYVQRLFGTKKALFIAALEQVSNDILAAWERALTDFLGSHPGPATPRERIGALEPAYDDFVREVSGLRLVLQASAAAADDDIRDHLKTRMSGMFRWLRESTGADYEDVQTFWAQGMMLTVAASIGVLEDVENNEWARAMLMMPETPGGRPIDASAGGRDTGQEPG